MSDDGDMTSARADDGVPLLKVDPHAETWREGYPYDKKMTRHEYEQIKRDLQIELLKLQSWVKNTGQRIVLVFEGRDAAGKGGTIKRFTEHLNPRGASIVALEKPSERERTQWYFQRYVTHLPSAGEIVMFDRSWYNRAGVEQRTRFVIRQVDPVRQWKLSPMDIQSLDKWDDYTEAKEAMFFYTDTADAPWTVVKSNDKKRARLEAIRHILEQFDYDGKDEEVVRQPDRKIIGPSALLSEKTSVQSFTRL